MPLQPDLTSLRKPQIFPAQSQEIVFVKVRLAQPYVMGGYQLTSQNLFEEDGWNFAVLGGWIHKETDGFTFAIQYDGVNQKLRAWHMSANQEGDGPTDWSQCVAYLTVARW